MIRAASHKKSILVQVIDNGKGIKKEHINKIFDPFFTTRTVGSGPGLGLSTAYGIIKEHGGNIYAASIEEEGTTINVEIPCQSARRQKERVIIGKDKLGRKKNILVVDDEVFITDLCRTILEEFGHSVEVAQNGKAAVGMIDQKDYDLILLDVRMPGLTGPEVYDHILKKNPKIAKRVIFSTGDTVSEETHNFFVTTGVRYISKPFKMRQLIEIVNK